jgi:hypothetical protein
VSLQCADDPWDKIIVSVFYLKLLAIKLIPKEIIAGELDQIVKQSQILRFLLFVEASIAFAIKGQAIDFPICIALRSPAFFLYHVHI